jgi:hypothetical protein
MNRDQNSKEQIDYRNPVKPKECGGSYTSLLYGNDVFRMRFCMTP